MRDCVPLCLLCVMWLEYCFVINSFSLLELMIFLSLDMLFLFLNLLANLPEMAKLLTSGEYSASFYQQATK